MLTPNVTWPLLMVTAALPGRRWTVPQSRLHPQICHHLHLKDERQTQEERQTDRQTDGEREREREENKWLVTMMMEERGDHREFALTCSQSLHIHSPLADVHSQTPEGERSPRGHGVPPRGQSSPQSLDTHTYAHTIPILIPRAPLTSLLKHRSKSSDWSQRLRNKWRQIPDFCMAFSTGRHEEGCSRRIWHSTCANIFRYWKGGSQQSTWFWGRGICLSCV